MPSFSSLYRTVVDPVAAEEANSIRARVARSHPARASPLFHASNFMKQNTPTGRKVREGLAISAKTMADPVLMKASIARLQHDILALERETEKALRATVNQHANPNHPGLKRCLHDHANTAPPGTPADSPVMLRSIPLEDLKTALNLCSFVPDDPSGNAVRLAALTSLLHTSLDAWAETQIEWVRGYAQTVLGIKLPSERELLPLSASAHTSSSSPSRNRAVVAANHHHHDQSDEGNVSSILLLSRLIGCSAASPLVAALLRGIDKQTSAAEKESAVKQAVLSMPASSPARSLSRRRLAGYEQQQQIQQFFHLQQQLAAAGVPGFADKASGGGMGCLGDEDMVDHSCQTDESLVRVLLRKYRGSDGDDSTDEEDRGKKRTPLRTKNVHNALRSPESQQQQQQRAAFSVNVSTRVALEEAHLKVAELERKLLFYKSLETIVAEADLIGTATDLAFKSETLANLGLDVPSLVKNYEAAIAAAASPAMSSFGGVASESDFGGTTTGSPRTEALVPPSSSVRNAAASSASINRTSSPSRGSDAGGKQGGGQSQSQSQQQQSPSPNKKGGGSSASGGGGLAVPLAQYEASQEENRRLKTLLSVQQAVLSVVANELDVSDAFRDWVAWKKTMLNGQAELRKVTESLRVPVCSLEEEEEIAEELAIEEQQQQQQQQLEESLSGSRSPSRSPSQTSAATSARAEREEDAGASALDATTTSNAGKQQQQRKPGPLLTQRPTDQTTTPSQREHQEHRHELFGPTDVAYRRAVRENISLQRTLEKIVYRLQLLESKRI